MARWCEHRVQHMLCCAETTSAHLVTSGAIRPQLYVQRGILQLPIDAFRQLSDLQMRS